MSRVVAVTHLPSPKMNDAVRSFIDVEPIDLALVNRQHEAYRRALERGAAEVVVLDVNLAHADAVFIEDTAIVLEEVTVLTSMGAPTRRIEVAGIEGELRRRGLATRFERIEFPATLEGGDVLRVGRTLFVGATARTNREGIAALTRIVQPHGYRVRPVAVDGCLHLKTACTALPDGTLLVNPRWLDLRDLDDESLLHVAVDEPAAANLVLLGERVLMASAHSKTLELVRSRGFEVDAVDLSELAKAEGAATCLSLLIS